MHSRLPACLLTLVLTLLAGHGAAEQSFPWLSELNADEGAKASGERLMALPFGLHRLEPAGTESRVLLIGVHGYGSKGYEWVYPLKTLDDDQTATHFYRWDFEGCPAPAADSLRLALKQLLNEHPGVERIRILGHSYGGVLVASLLKQWDIEVPTEVHTVASPLAGISRPDNPCDYQPPAGLPTQVAFSQWRTIQALDNAFKDMPVDPQVVEVPGGEVTRLPETYRDQRLGHNWSISWVADTLKARGGTSAPPIAPAGR